MKATPTSPETRCRVAALKLGATVTLGREGKGFTFVEATSATRQIFGINGSHYLLCRTDESNAHAIAELWADMAERLEHETSEPCPPDCTCWDCDDDALDEDAALDEQGVDDDA